MEAGDGKRGNVPTVTTTRKTNQVCLVCRVMYLKKKLKNPVQKSDNFIGSLSRLHFVLCLRCAIVRVTDRLHSMMLSNLFPYHGPHNLFVWRLISDTFISFFNEFLFVSIVTWFFFVRFLWLMCLNLWTQHAFLFEYMNWLLSKFNTENNWLLYKPKRSLDIRLFKDNGFFL